MKPRYGEDHGFPAFRDSRLFSRAMGWMLLEHATRLQEVSISLQCNPNELAASTHLGLGKQLLQGILDCAFGNLHA
jgi:hypothetical protein